MTPARPPRPTGPAAHRRAAGFNLIEVMVSMGIFVIAFVAVASIFPTAITLQREAAQTVDDRAATATASALADSFKFDYLTQLDPPLPNGITILSPLRLQPLLPDIDGQSHDLLLPARTFGANPGDALAPEDRRYILVPMIQPTADPVTGSGDWRLLYVVLRRNSFGSQEHYNDPAGIKTVAAGWASDDDWWDIPADTINNVFGDSQSVYPGLFNLAIVGTPAFNATTQRTTVDLGAGNNLDPAGVNRLIVVGDTILGNNGASYVVVADTDDDIEVSGDTDDQTLGHPDELWFAPRPFAEGSTTERPVDATSPFIAIIDASNAIR
ncbi:MAG: prepilin-type N-terminal cleavage/methylation domain-containing protein [Planctomycetota bacterium]